ncbi:hypothetical protein [Nocardioides humi]|nr:hypothetical protein [Nocardioides humi]
MSVLTKTDPAPAQRPPSGPRRSGRLLTAIRRPSFLVTLVVAVVVGWLAIGPIVALVWETLWRDGSFTLEGVEDAYSAYGFGGLVKDSFVFAIGTTIYAVLQGGVLAYLAARTNLPFKGLIFASALVP